ncbi:winged helix-turn-helix domain-containing protein [Jiangella asiatica]|uniref:Winged helix family transcriptional regulator n=1 Tax=Jiangella asiatica TaxID=2530372 RepID=A0A4R5DFP0_9ACTN|nr:winged helix-turn-helix domain-containing protein [Jiangella asiatica]TDE09465.1 winged helix family transcriptional regulator [Jiangella asiatica]
MTAETPAGAGAPVVVCISDSPAERARLAGQFDGSGILVLAPDADSASTFLRRLDADLTGGRAEDVRTAVVPADEVVRAAGLRVDLAHHEASWRGQALALTPYELKVLGCLAGQPGRVWTYRQLHERAWEGKYFAGPAALQSVIKRLRAKLRSAGATVHIHATRGVGFRLDPAPRP